MELQLFRVAFNEGARFAETVEAVEPLLVFPGEVDRTIECLCPFKMLGWVGLLVCKFSGGELGSLLGEEMCDMTRRYRLF